MEFTLLQLNKELVLQQLGQDLSDMLNVCVEVVGEYQNIVQVNKHGYIKHLPEKIINEGLEDSRSINQAKWYYLVLVVACQGIKCSLLFVPLPSSVW